MSDEREDDTVEIPSPTSTPESLWPYTGSSQIQVDLAALSHPGLVRKVNEDHYLVARFSRAMDPLLTNLPPDHLPGRAEEVAYGLVVADGVGGEAAGEVASRMAIATLISLILHTPDWILSDGEREAELVMDRMAERYRRIDAVLRARSSSEPALAGMGTTMTLAGSLGASLVIGHIGDSRVYLLRGGYLVQLTRDHTLVQSLVERGQLSAAEAATHPFRHVLTRSLGGQEGGLKGDFQRAWLADGDQLLLCTDGLTGMVDDATIAAVLGHAASADEACRELVATALKNGGKDNVTVVLARYRFPQ
jgi:protein phosphatase